MTRNLIYTLDFEERSEELEQDISFVPTESLRERYFGNYWEGKSNSHYNEIWQHDIDGDQDRSPGEEHFDDVETPEKVLNRAVSLLQEIESKYTNKLIILVSHGDTLQILQTGFVGVHPRRQRTLPHLNTAEVRHLSTTSKTGQ